jgi:hypothetical protein
MQSIKNASKQIIVKGTKLKLHWTSIRPTVTCASETWVDKENCIQKLVIFESKILSEIFGPTKELNGL